MLHTASQSSSVIGAMSQACMDSSLFSLKYRSPDCRQLNPKRFRAAAVLRDASKQGRIKDTASCDRVVLASLHTPYVQRQALANPQRSLRSRENTMSENNGNNASLRLKTGLAEMLKGGVIMDVMSVEQAEVAEKAGAVAVMALESVPAIICPTVGFGLG